MRANVAEISCCVNHNLHVSLPRMNAIGKNVKRIREKKNIGIVELAELSGISRQYIYELETGTANKPSVDVASDLASALDVSLFELLGGNKGGK